jgi:tRNA-specific 2-thiouridylase
MKIALGMSGGVDSSVCAALLKQAGHDVTGVFLECWRGPGCRAEEDRKDALTVALDLGLPFEILDFKDAYKQRVVDIFLHDLSLGLTPNPDVWCNTEIKFGLFYDWAMEQGYDAVATGHYAAIGQGDTSRGGIGKVTPPDVDLKIIDTTSEGVTFSKLPLEVSPFLQIPADSNKDQTYFLYRTRQEQLEHIIFPLSEYTKPEVRQLAKKFKLPTAAKPDSQGICFIGDIDVRGFVRDHLGSKPGNVLDTEGNVIGDHDGVWFFTIGQRHGFRLNKSVHTKDNTFKHVLPPLYVISKDAAANTITVGYGAETMFEHVSLQDVFLRQIPSPEEFTQLRARFRHGGALVPVTAQYDLATPFAMQLILSEPLRGLAPGQAAVLYGAGDRPICYGGGVIL